MPYYRAPAERPRQPKRFLTSREVEDLAAAGQTEIVHQDDMVITDAARETAHDLDVRIVKPQARPAAAQAAAVAPAAAQPAFAMADVQAVRAVPVASFAPVAQRTAGVVDPYVQAIVQAVRARKG